jgi:hypothetical protein
VLCCCWLINAVFRPVANIENVCAAAGVLIVKALPFFEIKARNIVVAFTLCILGRAA